MQLNFYAVPNLASALSIFGIGLFVVLKKSKSHQALSFFLLTLSATAWQLGTFLVLSSTSPSQALFFCRLTYLGSLFIPLMSYHFIVVSIGEETKYKKISLFLNTIWFILFLPATQTPWFITGVYSYPWGFWWKSGPVHLLFLTSLSLVMSFSFFILYRKMAIAPSAKETARRKYILVALLVAYIGAVDYVPNYGIKIYPFGYIPLIFYIFITAYAIVRYQLLDIEVIIKKTLVFAGILSAAVSVIAIPVGLIQAVIGRNLLGVANPLIIMALGVATTILIYRPVERFLVDVTDKYLFQKKFDYRTLLKEASQEMASIRSLNRLAKIVVAFLLTKGRISRVTAFVQSEKDNNYVLKAARPRYQGDFKAIEADHPLIETLRRIRRPLDLEEAINLAATAIRPEEKKKAEQIVDLLEAFKAQAVVPSFLYSGANFLHKPELRSLLFLGPQKSDETYRQEDLDVFFTLAQESAIAIENARLYDEAIQRTREVLELKVQIATEEKMNILSNLTAGISHEVRNPLGYIHSSAQLIERMGERFNEISQDALIPLDCRKKLIHNATQILKYANLISVGANRVRGSVVTVENYAKKNKIWKVDGIPTDQSSRSEPKFSPINLALILPLIRLELEYKYKNRNEELCQIDFEIPKEMPQLYGYQESLEQVFINLISNAQDAMKGRDEKKMTIKAEVDPQNPEFVHISFHDTGCGISPEMLEKVFEKGVTTKEKEGGSGIGLDVCKTVVKEIHGGKIWCESTVGVGSVFHLTVPIWKGEPISENQNMGLVDED